LATKQPNGHQATQWPPSIPYTLKFLISVISVNEVISDDFLQPKTNLSTSEIPYTLVSPIRIEDCSTSHLSGR